VLLKKKKDLGKDFLFQVEGCFAAMGYSFAAGTTDGAGADTFKQSTRSTNPLSNTLTRVVAPPTERQIACQGSKPILFSFGEVKYITLNLIQSFPWLASTLIELRKLFLIKQLQYNSNYPDRFFGGKKVRKKVTHLCCE
jgi:hypothetical protein